MVRRYMTGAEVSLIREKTRVIYDCIYPTEHLKTVVECKGELWEEICAIYSDRLLDKLSARESRG